MANLNAVYHLDEPLPIQYGLYLVNLLQGNFGPSFVYRDFSVGQLFANGLPMSIQLVGRPFEEAPLLRVADVYQRSTDHHLLAPPGALRGIGTAASAAVGG